MGGLTPSLQARSIQTEPAPLISEHPTKCKNPKHSPNHCDKRNPPNLNPTPTPKSPHTNKDFLGVRRVGHKMRELRSHPPRQSEKHPEFPHPAKSPQTSEKQALPDQNKPAKKVPDPSHTPKVPDVLPDAQIGFSSVPKNLAFDQPRPDPQGSGLRFVVGKSA